MVMKSKSKTYIWRLLVSLGLLLFLFRYVNQNELGHILKNFYWPYLIGYFVLIFIDRLIMAYKWKILLDAQEVASSFGDLIIIYFKGTFVGNLLPTSLGGDAVRAYELSKKSNVMAEVIASIIMERFLGFLSSALMAILVTPLLVLFVPEFPQTVLLFLTLFLVAGVLFLFLFLRGADRVSKLTAFLGKLPWADKVSKISSSFVLYRNHPRALGRFFVWSFGEQLLPIVATFFLSLALGLSIPLSYLIPIIPIAQFFARIPVSLSGLGIQEGLFITIFSLIGLETTAAFALGFASNLGNILSGLPGVYFYLRSKPIPPDR
ncbi:MAG: hypothetical protein C0407_15475 [Desulfobacca sp.]|nr:hypothetical protein [Desulfobacca sp.]